MWWVFVHLTEAQKPLLSSHWSFTIAHECLPWGCSQQQKVVSLEHFLRHVKKKEKFHKVLRGKAVDIDEHA
jgi:hypothetical protein